MITVKNDGDFGNHLFQYFFLRLHAEFNNLEWYFLDHWVGGTDGFLGDNPKYNTAYKDVFNLFNLDRGNISLPHSIGGLNRVDVPNGYYNLGGEDNILYRGYFQSDSYFKEYKDKLREWLLPKPEYKEESKKFVTSIVNEFNCTVDELCVIHYRGTSYRNLGYDLSSDWFHKAMGAMKKTTTIKHFIIFTDDVKMAESIWGNKYKIISNSRLLDFVSLFEFKNFIISASSFSFWPAWLNGVNVIAPEFWFGHQSKTWKPSIDIKVDNPNWLYL